MRSWTTSLRIIINLNFWRGAEWRSNEDRIHKLYIQDFLTEFCARSTLFTTISHLDTFRNLMQPYRYDFFSSLRYIFCIKNRKMSFVQGISALTNGRVTLNSALISKDRTLNSFMEKANAQKVSGDQLSLWKFKRILQGVCKCLLFFRRTLKSTIYAQLWHDWANLKENIHPFVFLR